MNLDAVTAGFLDEELGSTRVVVDVVLYERDRVSARRMTSEQVTAAHLDLLLGERARLGAALERDVGSRDDIGVGLLLQVVRVGRTTESPELEVDDCARKESVSSFALTTKRS